MWLRIPQVRTQESYRSIIHRHILPSLGSVPLGQLQPQHIQSYYANSLIKGRTDGKGGLSARSVVYHHRILSKALSEAMKMGFVARNVAVVVDPPRPAKPKLNVVDQDDIPKLLDALHETPYFVLYCLLLYCGLRRGEALALRWRNVDTARREVQIVETAFKLGDGTTVHM